MTNITDTTEKTEKTENTETPKIILPKEEAKEEPKPLVLPRLESPIMQFNKDTKMFYIGIPVDKVAPFEAGCFFDSMKLNYLQVFTAVKQEMENKRFLASPGFLNRTRDLFLRNKK